MKKILLAAAVLAMSGCASIISDDQYAVTINSSPDEADFAITNTDNGMIVMKGKTPSTVTLDASNGFFDGADYQISFEKEGYDSTMFPLDSSIDGWYVGNILFGGLLGLLIVDPATGAMWKLDDMVSVSLGESAEDDEETTVSKN